MMIVKKWLNPSVIHLCSVGKTLTQVCTYITIITHYGAQSCVREVAYTVYKCCSYSLALTQAGQHMEDSIVASYTALLLAVLAKNSTVCVICS